MGTQEKPVVLDVRHLRTEFGPRERPLVAVDDVSFQVAAGEILGLVGESGSGKSITLRSILGIVRPRGRVAGEIRWNGRDLVTLSEAQLRRIRGREIAMIFQEPMSSLNPLLSVGLQISENLVAHTDLDARARKARAIELLELVGIPAARNRLDDFPHEFSGGMRQRVMIAIALASNPKLLLADEPTTALDVTIQDQILRLIQSLSRDLGMAVILVTHDMGVVAETCDRVAVMYGGRICEVGPTAAVIGDARHPYSLGLLRSIPRDVAPRTPLYSIPGAPPALNALPPGCAFSARCPVAGAECPNVRPALQSVDVLRQVACHHLADAQTHFRPREAAQ
ncbi:MULTISPECIES: ABC transporter ATP-binding protein [unclassified Ensifer]|uniref:ABC transporter ATP-binding protein n=1 Tax=unclassified Ensifer TaxID=2633371 RepID=UPI000813D314|nr:MULTISPECIES: ABC transporter ATP-binding protein [unclassified Ensifer]OCO99118.1 methionine ABC transporter ATP-binding protein [Ensifer sp. LC11]OCO99322.1 methionine ABC transporter ATP-binding protein [Ensifer sp. LC13]OCP12928.1 methionine ABC transporter ATP-binding protein [Ensifer sp. LC14]OCP29639.1 methionine ABC transporter ATP-binding protein [Ensifer sp. LC499]